VLGEVAFLIAVAVALGVAKLQWWIIVAVMAAAFLVVVAIEWLASRESLVVARETRATAHPVVEADAVVAEESEAVGWAAFEEAQEPSDAMTMIGAPSGEEAARSAEDEPSVEESVQFVEADVVTEGEAAPESVGEETIEGKRRRWWRRHSDEPETDVEPSAEPPRHVRVLSGDPQSAPAEPWERGFDEEAADESRDEDTDESLSTAGEQRRRFRRR
jgi:hypothetical protein